MFYFNKHLINKNSESHVSVEKIASTSDNDVGVENNDVTEKPDEVVEKGETAPPSNVMASSDNGTVISEVKSSKLHHQIFLFNFLKNLLGVKKSV